MKRCFRKWLICTKEIINIITQYYFTPYKMKKHHYMYTYTCLLKKKEMTRGPANYVGSLSPILMRRICKFSCVLQPWKMHIQLPKPCPPGGFWNWGWYLQIYGKTTIPSTALSFKTWNTSALLLNSLFLVNPFFWLTPVNSLSFFT